MISRWTLLPLALAWAVGNPAVSLEKLGSGVLWVTVVLLGVAVPR